MVDLSIVTGTYNRLPFLKKLVASCRRSVGSLEYEIILIDGGSTDGTIKWAGSQDNVVLIEQGELLGAIKAFNAGCKIATGRFVALLNDDVEVVRDSLLRAVRYLDQNPQVGQVAMRNDIAGTADKMRRPFMNAYGYLCGQCCVTRKVLGDLAGWWGDEGMRTYGGDTRLSLRLWEMGYSTIALPGCEIIDHVAEDELRKINSDDPWRHARKSGGTHPDMVKFRNHWHSRMPHPGNLIPAVDIADRILLKAGSGNLRTLRFKGMMAANHKMRHSLVDVLTRYGDARQINQAALLVKAGNKIQPFQDMAYQEVISYSPDLVILQAQRRNNFLPETVMALREKLPWTYFVNFDGDVHYPLRDFNYQIGKAVHLQCVTSPSIFPDYVAHGVYNVAYWPIGIEDDYVVDRAKNVNGPDVVFLGALYGHDVFPDAQLREDAAKALWKLREAGKIDFLLLGNGWRKIGMEVGHTNEQHSDNARLYSRSRMALSISQTSSQWGYTSDRLYNICAAGCPALVKRFNGMGAHGFIDGYSCIAWDTIEEMVEKMRYYLDHKVEAEGIGYRGKEVVENRHTWSCRVDGLFSMIKEIR